MPGQEDADRADNKNGHQSGGCGGEVGATTMLDIDQAYSVVDLGSRSLVC